MPYRISQEASLKGQMSPKQTQRLMMSAQMQQALHLLQLPVMELSQMIEEEMEMNPVLELEEEAPPSVETEEVVKDKHEELDFKEDDFSILSKIDQEFDELVLDPPRVPRTQEDSKRQAFLESSIIDEPSLFEFLMTQAEETFSTKEELRVAEVLAGYIDERGFLTTPLLEIAAHFPYTVEALAAVLKVMQGFDPPGIAATSLQEALLIQLSRQNKQASLAYEIVKSHFDDLIHNRIPLIQKDLGATGEALSVAMDQIATLDNHPGLSCAKGQVIHLIPDVKIEEIDGTLQVIVNNDPLPTIRLNHKYLKMLQQETLTPETKKFIEEKLHGAKWLMKIVQQRETTLERIVKSLIQKDRDFFLFPEGKMKPLTMKTLSEELQLHESTIARAVANKYLSCPRGTLPLRSFFTSTFVANDGEAVSSHTVRDILKTLIENEDKAHPLSDETLSKIIQGKGIPCARRTVAKFRTQLHLGNQHQRRKFAT